MPAYSTSEVYNSKFIIVYKFGSNIIAAFSDIFEAYIFVEQMFE